MPPASRVRERVSARIRTVRPLPRANRAAVLARCWPGRLLAAAAAILVVGLGAVVTQPGSHEATSMQSPDGVMQPAGLIGSGGDQSVVLTGNSSVAAGAGIGVEPTGGSRQPTTAPIALFDFGHAR